MRGYANGAGQADESFEADIAEMERREAASVSLVATGPQVARLLSVVEVAGASARCELLVAGRCYSARRERVTVARAVVPAVVRGLRMVAASQTTVRARAEWNTTATLLETAVAS